MAEDQTQISGGQTNLFIADEESAKITTRLSKDAKRSMAKPLTKSRGVNVDWDRLFDTLPDPIMSDNGKMVLEKRYLFKDGEGKLIETPKDMFFRVARFIAKAELVFDKNAEIELLTKEFYLAMSRFDFVPNSPTLMNSDRKLGQLSACFVLPVADSMEDIFDAVKYTALIHKSGGGTGFSFSRLRPSGDKVSSTSGVSSGPITFMKAFNEATETVKQGGTRRGANMGILRIDHPDILKFIVAKEHNDQLNNFNISVALTDEFMKALDSGTDYNLINPRDGKPAGTLNAGDVYKKIVYQAWKNGEPGMIFLDRINKYNPTPEVGEIESTNPCGEQPLLPYEACNLGSINLGNYVLGEGNNARIDFDRLKSTVHMATRFLDNVIEVNKYPLPQIDKMSRANRKIGLGVMGFADLLIKLGVPYNSDKGLRLARKIMSFVDSESKVMSTELARRRGVFPNYERSIYPPRGLKLRNATTTTIAPTGSISIIANASSGVEPLFAVCYNRQNVLDNDTLTEVNPLFEEIAKKRGFYSEELIKEIAETGTLDKIKDIPEDIKELFATAQSISPEDHIKMQAAFQDFTDNAVSKTVNFPNSATEEDIKEAYDLAYQLGCKGVTVYRDGSRDMQVLNTGATKKSQEGTSDPKKEIIYETLVKPRPRPEVVTGTTEKISSGLGDMYITVDEDDLGINEVFIRIGKSGGEAAAMNDALARIISVALRSGVDPKVIIKHLKGIRGSNPIWHNGELVLSCPDAVAKAMERYLKRQSTLQLNFSQETPVAELKTHKPNKGSGYFSESDYALNNSCLECGGKIDYESGCYVCRDCGYSKCG